MSDPVESELPEVSILFATETCNAEDLSESAEKELTQAGFPVTRGSISEIEVDDLRERPVILIIASTWGEGEAPSEAVDFHEEFISVEPLGLVGTRFSVLGLGDTAYEHFCQCGKDFDHHLERHGAQRLYARADCDVDFDDSFGEWIAGVLNALKAPTAA